MTTMTRAQSKSKLAVLLSNYTRGARPGTADRLADLVLADQYALADLERVDPNQGEWWVYRYRALIGKASPARREF